MNIKIKGKKYKVNPEDFPIEIDSVIIGSIPSGRTRKIIDKKI